jgi:hypothetical protein
MFPRVSAWLGHHQPRPRLTAGGVELPDNPHITASNPISQSQTRSPETAKQQNSRTAEKERTYQSRSCHSGSSSAPGFVMLGCRNRSGGFEGASHAMGAWQSLVERFRGCQRRCNNAAAAPRLHMPRAGAWGRVWKPETPELSKVGLQMCSVHWPMTDNSAKAAKIKGDTLASFSRYHTTFWLAPVRQRYIPTFPACSIASNSKAPSELPNCKPHPDPARSTVDNQRFRPRGWVAQFASRPRQYPAKQVRFVVASAWRLGLRTVQQRKSATIQHT